MTTNILRDLNNWRAIKQQQAIKYAGTPEGVNFLIEAKRYGALQDEILGLHQRLAAASVALEAIKQTAPTGEIWRLADSALALTLDELPEAP